jgi:UDP-N-acetylmuramoylalanine--D-glutamate ligase
MSLTGSLVNADASRQPAETNDSRPHENDVGSIDLDTLDLDSFAGRPVAVLGLARSGTALARFLHDQRALVTVYDVRPLAELGDAMNSLEGRPIRLLAGPEVDPAEALRDQALIATSPSVSSRFPTTEPRLRRALADVEAEGRVPVVSEIDLFLRLCPARTIGVTGTKGKTTTASLCAAILRAGDAPVLLGGNIGVPLIERLPELTPQHRVVLELSELQLPTLSRGTHVAVYTHVTQDHLDRHESVDTYRAVKRRLAELVDPVGALVLNAEDAESLAYAQLGTARSVLYRRDNPPRGGVGVAYSWVVSAGVQRLPSADDSSEDPRVMPVAEISLPGAHNLSNVLAAVAVGLLFGVETARIRSAVAGFSGVPHRLETVAVVDGVRFVNDSQGTQPDAVIAALNSFPSPLILIAGGREKGLPLDDLARVAAEKAISIVLIGESAPVFEAAFVRAGHRRVERAPSLEEAVARADQIAREESRGAGRSDVAGSGAAESGAPGESGDSVETGESGESGESAVSGETGEAVATVLLSPAAASFDMFIDYAARGEAFRAAVAALAARRRSA